MATSDTGPGTLGIQTLCVAALIGVCALAWILGSLSGRQSAERGLAPRTELAAARDSALRDCFGVDTRDTFACLYTRAETGIAAARADQGLAAQQRLAFAALCAAIAALATAAIAAVGLVHLRQALSASRVSAAEARRIGEAQVRCYLGVARVVVDFTDHASPVVSCRIVNAGQSPALHTRWRTALVYDAGEDGVRRSTLHAPTDAHALTIPASDGAIPADICVAHDLADDLQALGAGAETLLFCTIELTAQDVFGHVVHVAEHFVGKLDARLFTNPLVMLQPYGGTID